MKKGLALIPVILLCIIVSSGCMTRRIVHIDWTDFVKWDGVSYQRDYNAESIPVELVGENIGFVTKIVPSQVSSPSYEPEDGMASFLPVGTEFFEIKGYDSSKYIAVYIDGEFILYKTRDSQTISFNDIENNEAQIGDLKPTKYETVNNFEGVTMIVKEGTVSSDGLILVLENNSEKECIYGEFFILEKKLDNKWYEVPVTIEGNYGFNDIGYQLNPGDEQQWEVNWQWLYGSLAKGEYRIIKDILNFRKTGDYDTYYLAAEFQLD